MVRSFMVQSEPAPVTSPLTAAVKAVLPTFVDGLLWTLTHLDDFGFALGRGLVASFVTHPEREVYPTLRKVIAGEEHQRRVKTLPREGRYLVVSDHHLLYSTAPHDYFGGKGGRGVPMFRNERIYAQMAKHYADEGFTLVENGDVEDLVVPEPAHDRLDCLAEGAVGRVVSAFQAKWNVVRGRPDAPTMRENARKRQLQRIVGTYRGYYAYIEALFPGRIVKLIGNHDTELLRADFARYVPYGVPIHEFALVPAGPDGPAVVICHGHQMDPWTCSATASEIGESITESFAWAGRGADRIWKTEPGSLPPECDNPLSPAGFGSFDGWIPKVRHMSERDMDRQLRLQFPGSDRPWIVLGHTHEARLRTAERYVNAASAGRYQDLVWAVELVSGVPTLVAWWCETDAHGVERLISSVMAPTPDERLVCADIRARGPLAPLPYAGRLPLADIDADIVPGAKPSPGWLVLRIAMHVFFLLTVALGVYGVARAVRGRR